MSMPAETSVLIVDDEPKNLLAVEAVLQPLGTTMVRASSGPVALRKVLEGDFAVILMDVQMPGMDGFEAAGMIRAREKSRNIPIIFLTGIGDTAAWVSRGYVAGAVDYLVKPIVPEILRAKVEIFVELATARLKLQEEMAARAKAAKEIESLNEVLAQRNAELMEANADLESFNQTVSHDLRTPLRHIQGYIEMLDASLAGRLQGTELEQLDVIKNAASRMNVLVNDLLSFCRLSRAHLTEQAVDMRRLVDSVLEILRPDLRQRAIDWKIEELGTVRGDRALLQQVWTNLISNAVKYSKKALPAKIVIERKDEKTGPVFRVTDNGVGFDMKYAEKLFGVFQRLHSAKEFDGVGIGLANVRRVIERHGGRVWAEASPGAGASFYFSLPGA
jgi:light-regulated signal transduction histidine kinase (bacteriophytochrome)